jgi:ABC-type branched-subunit amino acid transport system permease subunit
VRNKLGYGKKNKFIYLILCSLFSSFVVADAYYFALVLQQMWLSFAFCAAFTIFAIFCFLISRRMFRSSEYLSYEDKKNLFDFRFAYPATIAAVACLLSSLFVFVIDTCGGPIEQGKSLTPLLLCCLGCLGVFVFYFVSFSDLQDKVIQ